MSPEIGLAGFRIGSFMVIVSGVLLFFLTPGTPEHTITVVTLLIGIIFMLIIAAFVLIARRR
jgi:hypothetical protein